MLTDSEFRDLLDFRSPKPVTSVYLNTDASQGNLEAIKLQLRTLLKEVNQPADEAVILEYFDHERTWSGRSVAMFSCKAQDYFRAYPLAVPVRSRVFVGEQPYLKPLADLLDFYGGYGVALVDKQGARLFQFHLGELREQEGLLGEPVRHTKRGGASSFPGRRGGIAGRTRHAEEVADRNLKEVAVFAGRFFEENHVRRVLIGGSDENVAQFRGYLSKFWQSLVVGTFPMSMTASAGEVLARAMQVGGAAERARDLRLVDQIITAAAKGGDGVVRLDETLSAVHDGRVQTLVVADGFRSPGFRCRGCGFLTTQSLEKCPFCGKAFEDIPDAVELAIHRVLETGGDVQIVHDSPQLGLVGIGGVLRY